MARERDEWGVKRDRRKDDEDDDLGSNKSSSAKEDRADSLDAATDKFLELLKRAEPMIEQLNNLYNQFVAGVEVRPPLERRKQLDQTMQTLQLMPKPTPSYQFRFNTLQATYVTHRDRWDRLVKDLESGKIKRTAGPKRG